MPQDKENRDFLPVSERAILRGGSRHGVVIGIDKHQERQLDLRYAAADARALYNLMIDEKCGCFPRENVALLLNEQATTREVGKALSSLTKKVGPNDTVWIYFAGHGALEGDEAYWVTHDSDVHHLSVTGLDRTRINKELSKLRSERVLLFLDCCHAAATAMQSNALRGAPSPDELFARFEGKGVMTVAASDGMQKSVELAEFGRGVFTYYLEKGLRGEADENGDGVVTLNALWRYLHKKVESEAQRVNNKQTPVKHGSMIGDDIALTINAAVAGKIPVLKALIEGMVGIRAGQLSTEQGNYCVDLLHRSFRTDKEREVLEALDEVARGELLPKRFVPIVELAMRVRAPQLEAERAVSVNSPAPVVDADIPKPWGVGFGKDDFGYVTGFGIGNVVQRMRWIPPGTFMMGSPVLEQGRYDNEVQHRVVLTQGFWLGETPVTQALWQALTGKNPSYFADLQRPVEKVSWEDCALFISLINRLVPGGGFRFPTEAEWEYACRAGTTTATFAGDLSIDGDAAPQLEAIAWYKENSGLRTHPVAQKAANPWGLYDMLGNVNEWCADWREPYDLGIERDPQGPRNGAHRVIRGGSRRGSARNVRAANRDADPPDYRSANIGFRLARSPKIY